MSDATSSPNLADATEDSTEDSGSKSVSPLSWLQGPWDVPPGPARPSCFTYNGRTYTLDVIQQPERTRCCGIDKRDIITPAVCVRAGVLDSETRDELHIDEIYPTYFVVTVDLWNAEGDSDVNTVHIREVPGGGRIGKLDSYPPVERPSPSPDYDTNSSDGSPRFIRNLVGNLCASAIPLKDTSGKRGIWFVLQDLNVCTPGKFRLRVKLTDMALWHQTNESTEDVPVLATGLSDVFEVFLSSEFPGDCEVTPLLKCFAQQGVRIMQRGPSRHETSSRGDLESVSPQTEDE